MQEKNNIFRGKYPSFSIFPAFNVTIRSDRRGTCKGAHLVHACVGYCESSAFPSRYSVLVASNFTHNITSASRCCTISRDAKVREPDAAGGAWERGSGLRPGLTALRLLAGQSSPGLPPRPPPRRNRDPDGEGVPLRHVPQVSLLKPRPRVSRHPRLFLVPVSRVARRREPPPPSSFHCNPTWDVRGGTTFCASVLKM